MVEFKKYASEQFVAEEIAKIPVPDVSAQIEEHNNDENAHPDIREWFSNYRNDVIYEINTGKPQQFWRGTKEEFDAIEVKDDNVMYITVDDDGPTALSTKADWNQNDPDGPGYIANRPFYENKSGFEIIWDGVTEGLVSSSLETTYKISDLIIYPDQMVGTTIEMTDGNIITFTQEDIDRLAEWGCITDSFFDLVDFGIFIYKSNTIARYDETFPEPGFYTAKIEDTIYVSKMYNKNTTIIQKIDPKFLPDSIGTQSDWNENNAKSPAYVKNRPFYDGWIVFDEELLVDNLTSMDYGEGDYPSCTFYPDGLYRVEWNGQIYDNVVCIKNGYTNMLGGNNNLPFTIHDEGGNNLVIENEGDFTVSIWTIPCEFYFIKKLDYRFVPYCVAYNGSYAEVFNDSSNIATGTYSHAEGSETVADGEMSHAEGHLTIASGRAQHVQGKMNIADTTSAHIVGNGSFERSNAHTLDWDGNAWFAGDVYVGSTSGTNKDDGSKKLATKEYVQTAIADAENVFVAVYGETAPEDIYDAYQSGKAVFCVKADIVYSLYSATKDRVQTTVNGATTSTYVYKLYFAVPRGDSISRLYCRYQTRVDAAPTWTISTINLQMSDYLVTSITSSSTNTQYPSAKAVYSAIQTASNGNLKYTAQTLTDEQKVQARENIGAASINDIPIDYLTEIPDEYVTENELITENIVHGEDKELLSAILDTYVLNIDYDTWLAFNTSEIIINNSSTTSILGQAMLGRMILG